jgi:Zn-dependent peptidase ImmA (M78 family)
MARVDLSNENAEREAAALIESEWSGRGLPINPVTIARRLGAEVYEMALTDDVDGMLKFFEGGETPTIFVNQGSAEVRKRFTVAHELGHLVVQRRRHPDGATGESDVFYRGGSRNPQGSEERFSNRFAAALLMPRSMVKARFVQGKSDLVLANEFGVSLESMNYRLQSLGLKRR